MAERNEKILEISGLKKTFGGKTALDAINFEVSRGEFLSVLGPSGCGKTTLLRIIAGLSEPDEGKILKKGEDITFLPASKRNIGVVFQNYALFENMTALENVRYALKIRKEKKALSKIQAMEMLERMGLKEHADKKPAELSGGQQQRVAIARTLVLSPDIILFDEPMSALDVATRLSLRREIREIRKEFGTTMIYVTHDQEEAFAMSDRVMVMREAHIVQLDRPEVIVNSPADEYVKSFVVDNLRAKIDSLSKYAGGVKDDKDGE